MFQHESYHLMRRLGVLLECEEKILVRELIEITKEILTDRYPNARLILLAGA